MQLDVAVENACRGSTLGCWANDHDPDSWDFQHASSEASAHEIITLQAALDLSKKLVKMDLDEVQLLQ